ncbi:dihydrolipoamide acetyltransferase family protein [Spartinivicinus poritis]|uniref:Dihydrolipoamide acetyltransferase component of pyruvate dehydrogenase complex n=1 Tax=Spartinivicinus poritis TaxID=2994640 RepID=A0ABT5UBP4_9GAMM|nr:dihydrolipoamide acetyltransferase family protein [Spartinivicinus sp. A2-2]MDE1463605.1 dihydrolipoamide acetyltransferase family protein [Spartinivicinus sp. A2-2]
MRFFKLPDLGEGIPEADIVKWHVKPGEQVKEDQILVSVETAKAIVDVPAPQSGVIAKLFVNEGDTIHTGEPLVEFANEEDEDTGTVVGEIKQATEGDNEEDEFIIGASPSTSRQAQIKATPAVRALARRLNIDLSTVKATGANQFINTEDVEQAARLNSVLGSQAEPLTGVRKHMAKNMTLAHQEIVPVTLFDDADINHWQPKEDMTIRLVKALAKACTVEPHLNAWFDGERMARRLHKKVDVGIAVDTPQGLFVPVLRDVAKRDIADLRKGLNRLRKDVEKRTIPPSELQGATLTLSNFGTISGRYASPIVVPPTVCILGTGRVRREPVAINNEIVIHKIMPLSLTFDHRAVTGGEAARFLQAIKTELES